MKHFNPKKHHYVPQFILSNFCVGRKNRLYVFDKKTSNIFASNIRDVAHENHFYQDDEVGYEISTESKLADLEDKCAPIFEKIITEESLVNVCKLEHAIICLFITVQLTRTPYTREFLSAFNKQLADWFRGSGVDPNKDVANFKEQSESEIKGSSINILRSVPGDLAQHLLDKEWALLKSPKGEFFYISDHPVTMHNNFPRTGRGNLGLRLRGIEIHFPITPRLCLIFLCAEMIDEIRKKVNDHNMRIAWGTAFPVDMSEPESLITQINKKTTRLVKPENVEFLNSLQVIQSSRFVYSKNNGFELVKDMLKTTPELGEPTELGSNEYGF